jgi:hypothetical protein
MKWMLTFKRETDPTHVEFGTYEEMKKRYNEFKTNWSDVFLSAVMEGPPDVVGPLDMSQDELVRFAMARMNFLYRDIWAHLDKKATMMTDKDYDPDGPTKAFRAAPDYFDRDVKAAHEAFSNTWDSDYK